MATVGAGARAGVAWPPQVLRPCLAAPLLALLLSATAVAQTGAASAAEPSLPASGSAATVAPRASAASASGGGASLLSPSWAALTPGQKECLAPLAPEWDRLDSALKGKWLEIAARYPKLSPEHQQRLRDRMVAWTRMTPAERQKARIGYQHAGELRSEEQASRLQAKWEAYQALSPEMRQRLAERAAEKASERDGVRPVADATPSRRPLAAAAPVAAAQGPLTLTSSGPTVVLAKPGASTVLLTQRARAPLPGASAAGGTVRPLRSPRDGHLNPQTLLPQPEGAGRSDEASR